MAETKEATEAAVAAARRGSNRWEVMLSGRGVTFVTAHVMTTFHQRPTKRFPERVERMDMEFRDVTGHAIAYFRGVLAWAESGVCGGPGGLPPGGAPTQQRVMMVPQPHPPDLSPGAN